MERRRY